MGIAIIIPDVSFSELNIGQVTPAGNIPLVSLSISGEDAVIGRDSAAHYIAEYTPAGTTQRGVAWSIVSGASYATIDEDGYLSVLSGANESSVTIRATSTKNSSIYADKTITVTYITPIEDLTARFHFTGNAYYITNIILANGDYIKAKFSHDKATGAAGCIVGSRQLIDSDNDTNLIEVGTYQVNYQAIKSRIGGVYHYSNSGAERNVPYTVTSKKDSFEISPALGGVTEGAAYSYTNPYPLAVAAIYLADGSAIETFYGDIYGVEVYGSNGVLKHRLIPQSNLLLLDTVTGSGYSKSGAGNVTYVNN